MGNDVINALKRLERAGAEDSRTTEKLRAAARVLSDHVVDQLSEDVVEETSLRREPSYVFMLPRREMPRGYALACRSQADGFYSFVLAEFRQDQGWFAVDSDRQAALRFARAIATGWLDELAEWLENRAVEAE